MDGEQRDLFGFGETWYLSIGLFTWFIDLPVTDDSDPTTALRDAIEAAVLLLGDFALPDEASWLTESGGEDTLIQKNLPDEPAAAVDELRKVDFPDLLGIDIDLSVWAQLRPSAQPDQVALGATLLVEYMPDPERGPIVAVAIRLNTNLHARSTNVRTGGWQDNAEIAELNAWRVNDYLARLGRHFGQPVALDAALDYEDQVDDNGFVDGPRQRELWRRTDRPVPQVVITAQNALTIFDIGSYEEVLADRRQLASFNARGINKDITALRAVLAMPEGDVDVADLVAVCASVRLPHPTPEASRAWIERYVADLEQLVADTAPARQEARAAARARAASPDPDPRRTRAASFIRSQFATGGPYQDGLDHIARNLTNSEETIRDGLAAIREVLARPNEHDADLTDLVTASVGRDLDPPPDQTNARPWLTKLADDIDRLLAERDAGIS